MKQNIFKKQKWKIFTAAFVIVLSCGFLASAAYAKSAIFVDGWENTGESMAYLSNISKDNLEYTIQSDQVEAV